MLLVNYVDLVTEHSAHVLVHGVRNFIIIEQVMKGGLTMSYIASTMKVMN